MQTSFKRASVVIELRATIRSIQSKPLQLIIAVHRDDGILTSTKGGRCCSSRPSDESLSPGQAPSPSMPFSHVIYNCWSLNRSDDKYMMTQFSTVLLCTVLVVTVQASGTRLICQLDGCEMPQSFALWGNVGSAHQSVLYLATAYFLSLYQSRSSWGIFGQTFFCKSVMPAQETHLTTALHPRSALRTRAPHIGILRALSGVLKGPRHHSAQQSCAQVHSGFCTGGTRRSGGAPGRLTKL